MQIIALTGPRRCGKSTVAGMIRDKLAHHGFTSRIHPFAEPIYRMTEALTGNTDRAYLESLEFKTTVDYHFWMTGRDILNNIGKGLQAVNPEVLTAWWLKNQPVGVDYLLVPDLRLELELELLESMSAIIWHVARPKSDFTGEEFDRRLKSEEHHNWIYNNGDLAKLNRIVAAEIEDIIPKTESVFTYKLQEGAGHD